MTLLRRHWPLAILLLIVLGGAFFRFWQLDIIPPGVYPDEAKNANDALTSLRSGEYPLFYPENNGREGLYLWLIAFSFSLFGVSVASLKFVSAIVGTATIVAVYAMVQQFFLFAARDTAARVRLQFSHFAISAAALLTSGMVAFSFWHINFSRIAFRAIFVPFLLAAALALTFHGLRTRNIFSIIASALLWGLGYYTYIAFRVSLVIPLFLIGATFLVYLFQKRPPLNLSFPKRVLVEDGWWRWKVWGVVFAATVAPIGYFFLVNASAFSSRSSGISVFDAAQPLQALLGSLGVHLQMFFFMGDGNWRHNFAGEAQLPAPLAILFALGIIYAIWTCVEALRYRNWSLLTAQLTVAGGFLALLAPAFLTTESVPHALRAIGTIPFVYLYTAFGFLLLVRLIFPHRYHRGSVWPFGIATCLMVLIALASFQFNHYFVDWGKNDAVADAFSASYVAIGEHINDMEYGRAAYVVENVGGVAVTYPEEVRTGRNPILAMPAQTTLFIQQTGERGLHNTEYVTPGELPLLLDGPTSILPLNATEEMKQFLRVRYPHGEEVQHDRFWEWSVGD